MHPLFRKRLRPVAVLALLFFSWFCVEPWNFALAAPSQTKPTINLPSNGKAPSESLEENLFIVKKLIQEIDQDLASGKELQAKINQLLSHQKAIAALDTDIQKAFAATESDLKAKKLPGLILDRHTRAITDYTQNLKQLQTNLNNLIQFHHQHQQAKESGDSKTADQKKAELKASIKSARAHLEEKVKESSSTPLDPNHLPHRAPKVQEHKPRLKKEEFTEFQKPIQLAFNGDPSSLLLVQSTQDFPKPEDVAETIEVRFTPEIRYLAATLNGNPVKLYEHVKNNIVFEPYYGSLKGAQETLLEAAGNDFDQASLLIALLRTSGVPARYVYGTVEIPIEKVMAWVGVEKEEVAAKVLATAGIPVAAVVTGSKITSVQVEHVWVEAYVSYENYRGHQGNGKKQWIPLDPSFKQLNYRPGPDLKQMMQFDPQGFLEGLTANSTIDTASPSVTNMSQAYIDQQLQTYQTNLTNAINATFSNATPQDLIGNDDLPTEILTLLPATLPYRALVTASRYSVVPDTLRYRLKLDIPGDIFGTGALSFQSTLTELAAKKITVAYLPATEADEATLDAYGQLSATPAYLVNMKPALMMNGVLLTTGGAIGLGQPQKLMMTFTQPGVPGTDQVFSDLTVGGYYAIGLSLQKISTNLLSRQTDKLAATQNAIQALINGTPATISREDIIGDMLYATAINYFYNLGAAEDLTARVLGLNLVRQPSEAIVFVDLKVNSLFGLPSSVRPMGLSIDVDRNVATAFSRTGDTSVERAFLSQAGMYSSMMEHVIFERMFNVNAVSMVKVFQSANTGGIPVFGITSLNLSQVLPLLQVPNTVKIEIQNAVQTGKIVTIPKQMILIDDWQGIGYLVSDPVTLAGAYRISGGLNGGSTTGNRGNGPNLHSACTVMGDWAILVTDIDRLLAMANALLFDQQDLSPLARVFCELVQGINPHMPGAQDARLILQQFTIDVSWMIAATLIATNLPVTITGGDDIVIWVVLALENAVQTGSFTTISDVAAFDAYFILHYLYQYLVFFNLGLLPENQNQF